MMAETTKADKAPKPSYIKGLKAEFKKVVWPDQETVAKQSLTVVAITIVLGTVIGILDFIIKWGFSFII